MRILVVSHTYITPINRKKWQTLALLFPNVDITVVFPDKWSSILFNHKVESNLSFFDSKNCKFVALKAFKTGNEVLYWYSPLKLFNLIKQFRPEIIHVEQGDNAFSYFQCIFFSKLLRLKSKILFFTWVNWREKISLKYKIFWRWIENFNLKNSNGAITGNVDAAAILKSKGFSNKICVLPQLGVDTSIFAPAERQNLNIKKIGFVGRLVEEKGIFDLLQAFSGLVQRHPDWNLVFIGSGRCETQLKDQIKKMNLSDCVCIENTVPHDQVANFIKDLEILVLPSFDTIGWREQFGHVLIEAMACGISVIGSDAGEIPNVISDVGLIFEQKSIKSLQVALNKLMSDKALRLILGRRGYEKVVNEYSHQAIAKKTYDFWKNIMQN